MLWQGMSVYDGLYRPTLKRLKTRISSQPYMDSLACILSRLSFIVYRVSETRESRTYTLQNNELYCSLFSTSLFLAHRSSLFLLPAPCIPIFRRKSFSKHVDPSTGYLYYENDVTGERHWDRPLDGVASLQPKSPRPQEKLVDAA